MIIGDRLEWKIKNDRQGATTEPWIGNARSCTRNWHQNLHFLDLQICNTKLKPLQNKKAKLKDRKKEENSAARRD